MPAVRQTRQHRHVAVPIAASNRARLLPNSRPISPPATPNPGTGTADSSSDTPVSS